MPKLDLLHRTHVHKVSGKWRVDYMLPYSGPMYADFDTWDEAMADAELIENQRPWI